MTIQVYRDAYTRDAGNIDFGEQQTSGLSAGGPTQWFNAAPKKGKSACMGLWVKCIYVLTASAAQSPVSGSDALDPILGTGAHIDVSPGSGTSGRSQNLTRQFIEFAWAATTNTSFSVASLPTFASAGTSTVTVSFFVPTGGISTVRITLPGALTASYSADVTVSYTSITTQIVSTNFAGVCAFREEKSASIGSGMQSMLNYLPKDIAPDVSFMQGESSSTISQVLITSATSNWILSSTDTDALESAAASYAPIAGATYTTTAGFVLALDQQTFSGYQLYFASATTHYIGFLQVTGGGDVLESLTPAATAATPAVTKSGAVTPSGGVAATGGSASASAGGGGTKGILNPPVKSAGRLVYK